jgi:glycosyltransferase involved in cell wall biosynthesis
MKKIKTAFIIDHLDVGGTETQLYLLLKNMDQSRFEPVVFCLKEKGAAGAKIEALGIEVKLLTIEFGFMPKIINRAGLVLALFWQLKQRNIDVVQTYLITANIFGSMAAKIAGVKVICASERSIRNTDNHDLNDRNLVFKFLSRFIDIVSGNSKMVVEYLQKQVKVPENKTICIYNGIQTDIKVNHNQNIRHQLNVSPDGFLLGIVGRLVPQKNHAMLFKAVARIYKKQPNFKLIVIGDGPRRNELEMMVESLGLSKVISFLGNRSDVRQLLPVLDLVIQTSNFEGLPNVIMEAMSAGLPVIATDAGGTKELMVHQETGYLIPCGDENQLVKKLSELLKNPLKMQKMGSKGKAYIRQYFSINQLVEKTQNLYLNLLKNKA